MARSEEWGERVSLYGHNRSHAVTRSNTSRLTCPPRSLTRPGLKNGENASPYMSITAAVRTDGDQARRIPGVLHVDGTGVDRRRVGARKGRKEGVQAFPNIFVPCTLLFFFIFVLSSTSASHFFFFLPPFHFCFVIPWSARLQTVTAADAPLFHRLIEAFLKRTGVPMVLNTSFNRKGQPIVETPEVGTEECEGCRFAVGCEIGMDKDFSGKHEMCIYAYRLI